MVAVVVVVVVVAAAVAGSFVEELNDVDYLDLFD